MPPRGKGEMYIDKKVYGPEGFNISDAIDPPPVKKQTPRGDGGQDPHGHELFAARLGRKTPAETAEVKKKREEIAMLNTYANSPDRHPDDTKLLNKKRSS
ncbi:MAG: hypothetical protein AAB408_00950 [Patescibacteria group bacterium]|mgnify:CR=1 FL=1